MPANIGKIFYYGETPWHQIGRKVDRPLNAEEAIKAAGLDWEVEMIQLTTLEKPASPVESRLAVVRRDRKPGDSGRVVGVAHPEFKPLQNRDGTKIFDAIFGKGKAVYHTGGYLGHGEKVWLMAKLPREIKVGIDDVVMPFALFSNSHDGSLAIDFRLTTVRVVCQNTLSIALHQSDARTFFQRSHQGNYNPLQEEAQKFFEETIRAVDNLQNVFCSMLQFPFSDQQMKELVEQLLPLPKKPTGADQLSRHEKSYQSKLATVTKSRNKILELRETGKGTDLSGVKGSLWGSLNAVLEFVDHHMNENESSLALGLFGGRASLKQKAFNLASSNLKMGGTLS